jgi:hypothetical protein
MECPIDWSGFCRIACALFKLGQMLMCEETETQVTPLSLNILRTILGCHVGRKRISAGFVIVVKMDYQKADEL